jgi:hypothetical protein
MVGVGFSGEDARRIAQAVRQVERDTGSGTGPATDHAPQPPRVDLLKITSTITDGYYPARLLIWHDDTETWVLEDEIWVRGANGEAFYTNDYHQGRLAGAVNDRPLYLVSVPGIGVSLSDDSKNYANVNALHFNDPFEVTEPAAGTAHVDFASGSRLRIVTNACPSYKVKFGVSAVSAIRVEYAEVDFWAGDLGSVECESDQTGCCP